MTKKEMWKRQKDASRFPQELTKDRGVGGTAERQVRGLCSCQQQQRARRKQDLGCLSPKPAALGNCLLCFCPSQHEML